MQIHFEPILPPEIKIKEFRFAFLNGMRKFATKVKKEYRKTTATWEHKPRFDSLISLKGVGTQKGPTVLIGTDDQIYRWVDEGTGQWGPRGTKYPIWAGYYTGKSDKKVLAFPSAFTPKTKPGTLNVTSGYKGEVDTFRPYVMHPGIETRDFSGQIHEIMTPVFTADMALAMAVGAEKCGWGM